MSEELLDQNEIAELVRRMHSADGSDKSKAAEEAGIPLIDIPEGDIKANTAQVMFADVVPAGKVDPLGNLDHLGHVNMELEIVLGEATLTVGELISMDKDTVIPLRKLVGDNAQILANGRAVAEGEIVVLNDRFAFRVHSVDDKREAAARVADVPAVSERNEDM